MIGRLALGSIFVLAALAGCQPAETTESDSLIGESLRTRTGLISVFPPREDVRVGDMYAYAADPESGPQPQPLEIAPRWGMLEGVTEAVRSQYTQRPDFPKTPDEYLPSFDGASDRTWAEATAPEGIFLDENPTDRLRMVVLPGFTLTRGSLTAIVPTDAMNLAVGHAWNEWESVTMQVRAAESYSLDLDDLLDLVVERNARGDLVLRKPYRDTITVATDPKADTVWVRVVAEVLFMRAIQISITTDNARTDDVTAAELNLDVSDDDEPTTVLDPAYAAIARADAINTMLQEAGADVLPDGFVRFLSVSDGYISLQRVWRRPAAIGVRGLSLEVDAKTGTVLAAGIIGRPFRSMMEQPAVEVETQ